MRELPRLRHVLSGVLMLAVSSLALANGTGEADTVDASAPRPTSWDTLAKYDPPLTVTTNFLDHETLKLPDGETITDNYFTQWAEERLGIRYEAKWIAANAEVDRQKLNLALASGDLPDVVRGTMRDIMRIADAGLLMPINDVLDQFASPLTDYIINEVQGATAGRFFTPATIQGNIYGLPAVADFWANTASAIWMRQDKLDELGLEPPSTLSELEDVLAAYKAAYPDNVPLLIDQDFSGIYMTVMDPVGAMPFKWVTDEDDDLVYGSLLPEVKIGLGILRDWYAKGYLDREFVVKDFGKVLETMVACNALAMEGRWWFLHWPLPDMAANVPDARMVTVPAIAGQSGERQIAIGNPMPLEMTAINRDFAFPESQIYQLNEYLDSSTRDDEDLRDLMAARGYDYMYPFETTRPPVNLGEIGDEQGTYSPEQGLWDYEMPGPRGFFNTTGLNSQHAFRGFFMLERATAIIDMFEAIKRAEATGTVDGLSPGYKNQLNLLASKPLGLLGNLYELMEDWEEAGDDGIFRYEQFLGAPTETMISTGSYLDKLEQETFAKIIMGEAPLDAFDEFVDQWLNAGGAQVTEEVNAWYSQVR